MFTRNVIQKTGKFLETDTAAKLFAATTTVGLLYAGSRSPVKDVKRDQTMFQDGGHNKEVDQSSFKLK